MNGKGPPRPWRTRRSSASCARPPPRCVRRPTVCAERRSARAAARPPARPRPSSAGRWRWPSARVCARRCSTRCSAPRRSSSTPRAPRRSPANASATTASPSARPNGRQRFRSVRGGASGAPSVWGARSARLASQLDSPRVEASVETPRKLEGEKAQRIIAAMRSSVGRRGAAGSTFDHVAREAGVSRGLLHYYFGSKERLLVEVVRQRLRGAQSQRWRSGSPRRARSTRSSPRSWSGSRSSSRTSAANRSVLYEMLSASRHSEEIRPRWPSSTARWREQPGGGAAQQGERGRDHASRPTPRRWPRSCSRSATASASRSLSDPEWDREAAFDLGVRTARRLLGAALSATRRLRRGPGRGQPALQLGGELGGRDAHLLERVAVAQRHCAVLHRLVVHGHPPGRADLVLAAIALADRAAGVELGRHQLAQLLVDLAGALGLPPLFTSGSTATLIGAILGISRRTVRCSPPISSSS